MGTREHVGLHSALRNCTCPDSLAGTSLGRDHHPYLPLVLQRVVYPAYSQWLLPSPPHTLLLSSPIPPKQVHLCQLFWGCAVLQLSPCLLEVLN